VLLPQVSSAQRCMAWCTQSAAAACSKVLGNKQGACVALACVECMVVGNHNQWDALTEMVLPHTGALHVLGQSVVAAVGTSEYSAAGTSEYSAVAKRSQSDIFDFAKTYQSEQSDPEDLARIEQAVSPVVAKILSSAVEKLEPPAVIAVEKIEPPVSANFEQLPSVLARTERADHAAVP